MAVVFCGGGGGGGEEKENKNRESEITPVREKKTEKERSNAPAASYRWPLADY